MTYKKPSRLYRATDGIPKPMFTVDASNLIRTDDLVTSVSIHHGKQGTDEGVNPSTCEVVVPQLLPVRTRLPLTVSLTDAAATEIARRVGHTAAAIKTRFTGRAGRQEVEDTPKRSTTTLTAASYTAQLAHARNIYTIPSLTLISDMLATIMRPSYLASRITVESPTATPRTYGEVTGTYSDLIDKYATEIGLALQQTRDGAVRVLTLAHRRQFAQNRIPIVFPITRSHALSPATWSQPNDAVSENLVALYRDGAGQTVRYTADLGSPVSAPENVKDWQHVSFATDQYKFVNALEARMSTDAYTIPSIRVDVLSLLNSPHLHHRYQAGYVLALNPGDTLNLSGDWHPNLRGVHFVTAISEHISGGGWEFELHLTPYLHVIGEPSPEVPPRVWESATSTWDGTAGTWDEY